MLSPYNAPTFVEGNYPKLKQNVMKKKTGFAIIIIGLLITVFSGLNFMHKEVILETEVLTISSDRNAGTAWIPMAGVVTMAVGGLLIYRGVKNKESMS
jgi:hypothetical protein